MALKIYIDTNIYINAILNRDNNISKKVLSFLAGTEVILFLNDVSIINIDYIVRKLISKELIIKELKEINKICQIVCADSKVIDMALDSDFSDFEDAIQYFCAKRADVDLILTDNIKDFKNKEINVLTAKDFLNKYIEKL